MTHAINESSKEVLIIAGPNGAGKTTFARTLLAPLKDKIRFINADYIAAGLSPFEPEIVAVRAGKIMLEEVSNCVDSKQSFAVETTLSGRSYIKHIKKWQNAGYRVTLLFLSVQDVSISIDRVAKRVRQGGHNIPIEVIKRRFKSGLHNFNHIYKDLVDNWLLYDSSTEQYLLLDSRGSL